MDIYIKNYEKGAELSNPLFQKIFDFLFEDPSIKAEEFMSKYEYVKSYYGKKDEGLSSLHSKSISSLEVEQDEYVTICDNIISLIENSKTNTKFQLSKIKCIEKLLLEDAPEFDVVWQGKKNAVIKLKNLSMFFLCLVMSKDDPDGFKSEDVFFSNQYKYCKLKEDQSCDYLVTIANSLERE